MSAHGLDSRRLSSVFAPGKFFTFTVFCSESPLSLMLFNIEFPTTKIFCLIWLLLDFCLDYLMVGFLCFDILAALELEVSVSL